jgi:hypothetical protein
MPAGRCCWKAGSTGRRCRSRPRTWTSSRRKHTAAREIALAFGVPPMLLGIPGDNTFANYQEANRVFFRQTVLPLAQPRRLRARAMAAPAFGDGHAASRSTPTASTRSPPTAPRCGTASATRRS